MKIIRENDKYYLLKQDRKLEFTEEAYKMILLYNALTVLDIAKDIKFKTAYVDNHFIHNVEGITIFTDDSSYFFKDYKHFLEDSGKIFFNK